MNFLLEGLKGSGSFPLFLVFSITVITGIGFGEGLSAQTASPIRIGSPLSLGFVYGRIRFDPRSHQVIPARDPREGAVGTIFQWQH